MEPPESVDLERSLSALLRSLNSVPHLPAEMARARREFFGADRPEYAGDEAAVACALVRFGEWYALERESEVIGEIPLDSLRRRGNQAAENLLLQDSTAGVFLVERVESKLAQVRDLQDQQTMDLVIDPDSLRPGDLLAGRLYQGPAGARLPSPVLSIQSGGADLGRAFQRDLQQMHPGRRLTQVELEHLLLRRWAERSASHPQPLEHLEARLQVLLQQGGADGLDATEISDALRDAPQPAAVIGPILEQMAFETQMDLDPLRTLLLEISAHRAGTETPVSKPEPAEFHTQGAESLGQSLARRIEEGLARQEDMDDLFASVGEMLGEDHQGEEELTEESAAQDTQAAATDVGDLEPLVREFLWQTGEASGAPAKVLQRLVALQQEMPVPKTDLEYLESDDMLRLLLLVYLESPPQRRAGEVRAAYGILEQFYGWAERTQEYQLSGVLRECAAMVGDVQRVADSSLALSEPGEGTGTARTPCLMRVTELHDAAVALQVQGKTVVVPVPTEAAAGLRIGDILLGVVNTHGDKSGTLAGMVVVVPDDLERLMG